MVDTGTSKDPNFVCHACSSVGWDDARGHPIYRHSRPLTTKYYPKGSKVNIVINKHNNLGGGVDRDCDGRVHGLRRSERIHATIIISLI